MPDFRTGIWAGAPELPLALRAAEDAPAVHVVDVAPVVMRTQLFAVSPEIGEAKVDQKPRYPAPDPRA